MSVKSGFIYMWYDKRDKRYYIGSHWGSEDDGYVCSSKHMSRSYKKRASDFKRRILERGINSKNELLEKERAWLQLIDDAELGGKYYNLVKYTGHWYANENVDEILTKLRMSALDRMKDIEVRKHLSRMLKGRSMHTPESKAKIGNSFRGKPRADHIRKKISAAQIGRTFSDEHKEKLKWSEDRKRLHSEKLKKVPIKSAIHICDHCGKQFNAGNFAQHRRALSKNEVSSFVATGAVPT